jgi:hypothetical protein
MPGDRGVDDVDFEEQQLISRGISLIQLEYQRQSLSKNSEDDVGKSGEEAWAHDDIELDTIVWRGNNRPGWAGWQGNDTRLDSICEYQAESSSIFTIQIHSSQWDSLIFSRLITVVCGHIKTLRVHDVPVAISKTPILHNYGSRPFCNAHRVTEWMV